MTGGRTGFRVQCDGESEGGGGLTILSAQGCERGNILMHVGMGTGSCHMMEVMIIAPRLYDNTIDEERAVGWRPHCMR